MKIHIVTETIGGYAREDSDDVSIAGAFQSPEVARLIALCVRGKVHQVELDAIAPGYRQTLNAYGFKLPGDQE